MATTTKPVTHTDVVNGATVQAAAEAEVMPTETARERLARLEAENKTAIADARAEVRKETKAEQAAEFDRVIAPELAKIDAILKGIEKQTGKVFRTFSYRFKNGKNSTEEDRKPVIKHSLVKIRGESTAD